MTYMDFSTIKRLRPGRVLDGHVHDALGVREPIWPYSTHPNARALLRDWLRVRATLWLPGQAHAGDDCILEVPGLPRQSFHAVSENHALCLAVLLTESSLRHGRKIPVGGFW